MVKAHRTSGGCVLGCLGLLSPRIVLVILWLATDYLGLAYETVIWPLLGFIFLPILTLGYAVADNEFAQEPVLFWAVVGLSLVLDLGLAGGGSWGLQYKKKR